MTPKCENNCGNDAEYLVLEDTDMALALYCQNHFDELASMEGQNSMTYWALEDFDWTAFVKRMNEKMKLEYTRYSTLLKKFGDRPQAEKMHELGGKLHRLADEVWNA